MGEQLVLEARKLKDELLRHKRVRPVVAPNVATKAVDVLSLSALAGLCVPRQSKSFGEHRNLDRQTPTKPQETLLSALRRRI